MLYTFNLYLQLLFQGSFPKKKLNNHIVEIHTDQNIMNDLGPPEAPLTCHLPPFPVCHKSATTVAKTSLKKQPV